MADIFFSYKNTDRDRVGLIHDALEAEGFDVFWDQEVEPGVDWDIWIRKHLTQAKCVMVFWSAQSINSDNVHHEATVAKKQNKLIHVLLDPLSPEQFPMGLYTVQAANLVDWKGDVGRTQWKKLRRDVDQRLTPLWVRRQIAEFEAELVAERARTAAAESREKGLQAQIVKEAQAQVDLKHQRDKAMDEGNALRTTVEELRHAHSEAEMREAELSQRLSDTAAQQNAAHENTKRERDKAIEEVRALNAKLEELRQTRSEAESAALASGRRAEQPFPTLPKRPKLLIVGAVAVGIVVLQATGSSGIVLLVLAVVVGGVSGWLARDVKVGGYSFTTDISLTTDII